MSCAARKMVELGVFSSGLPQRLNKAGFDRRPMTSAVFVTAITYVDPICGDE
jgi:hypothetical protein